MKYLFNWKTFNESSFFPVSSDTISLGTCPIDETPIQTHVENEYPHDDNNEDGIDLTMDAPTTDPDYLTKQEEECRRYVNILQKRFVVCSSVTISVNHEKYEGSGGYYEAVVKYNADDTDQNMQAHFIEDNLPYSWDELKVYSQHEYQVWYDENIEYHTGSEF